MSKMHYFSNKFSIIVQALRVLLSQCPLIIDFVDLKLHDLYKLWVFELIATKSNFKSQL